MADSFASLVSLLRSFLMIALPIGALVLGVSSADWHDDSLRKAVIAKNWDSNLPATDDEEPAGGENTQGENPADDKNAQGENPADEKQAQGEQPTPDGEVADGQEITGTPPEEPEPTE